MSEIKRIQDRIARLLGQFEPQNGEDEGQGSVKDVVKQVQKAGELLRTFDDAVARI